MISMKGKVFVDSNILVYLFSKTELEKATTATLLVKQLISEDRMVWSTQVMQEFYVVMTKKYKVPSLDVKNILSKFSQVECVTNTQETINSAIDIQVLNKLSFWDSLIMSSAKTGNCSVLISADLNAGQVVNGIRIINPFLS